MKKRKFNLVYSSINSISPHSRNLFLGEWIKKNIKNKKTKDEFYDHDWLNKKKLLKDFNSVKKIYKIVLKNFSNLLNQYHKKKFATRQWEIILFSFLSQYISVAYDRWKMIEAINKKFKLKKIELIKYNTNDFICDNSQELFNLLISHQWNDWIIAEIIKEKNLDYYISKKKNKKKIVKKKYNKKEKLFPISFKNNNKFFIKNLELSRYNKINLNLRLKQLNFFYDEPSYKNINYKSINTKKRKIHANLNHKNDFLKFIIKNLLIVLPKNYFENFNDIENKIDKLNWPKEPDLILTSYGHYYDDYFKIYTAKKIAGMSKFVILQHGHQGHHEFCGTYFEKRICDKYLSWGNKDKDKKVIPFCVSTNIGKKIKKNKPEGVFVKITEFQLIPWKCNNAPREIQGVNVYKDNILEFLQNLKKKMEKNVIIKTYDYNKVNYVSSEISKILPKIKIKKISKLIGRGFEDAENKKIIIETFNSTGFIELLSMNTPVILLTSKLLFSVKTEYRKYYNELIKNKIIWFDAKKAGEYVNKIYPKIDDWWFTNKRQRAIKIFCENMCKYEKSQMKNLPKILMNISKEKNYVQN